MRAEDFATAVPRHQFPLGVVAGSLALVLQAGTSLKRVAKVLEMNWSWWGDGGAVGSYYSVRLWLLRLGLHQLQAHHERAEDWMWIVDHTMQLGEWKCLIIVGLRQSAWDAQDRCLSHQDVQLIDLQPVTKSTGEVVCQQLEAATAKTGVPRAIISDDGRDLHKGINQFLQTHANTVWMYDIKHKTACLLKHEFEKNASWQAFIREVNLFKQRVSVTPLACLLPPQQRGKARYLNIDVLVDWAETKLAVLENPDVQAASGLDSIVVEEKLGWLREYRSQVQQWREVMEVIECTERYVRHHGIHRKASKELAVLLPNSTCGLASKFRQRLLEFVEAEGEQTGTDERLLGSSEVLESIIGKYKCIAGERGQHGLTGIVLAIGALVGRMTVGTVQDALEQVTCQDARSWCQSHLGPTVQGLRQRITSALKSEQKQQTTIPDGA